MKHIISIILIIFSTSIYAISLKQLDNEMNQVYSDLLKTFSDNPVLIKKLQYSQKVWLEYRRLQTDVRDTDGFNNRSAWSICAASDYEYLTVERIAVLKSLDNSEEGNVCSYLKEG